MVLLVLLFMHEFFVLARISLKVALLFLLVSVLLLRLNWPLSFMLLIMLGLLAGVSYGWRAIRLL